MRSVRRSSSVLLADCNLGPRTGSRAKLNCWLCQRLAPKLEPQFGLGALRLETLEIQVLELEVLDLWDLAESKKAVTCRSGG